MRPHDSPACPRCAHRMLPVFAVEGARRRVVALTCPQATCDHMQMLTRDQALAYERDEPGHEERRRTAD